jgi:hypothetical protein
VEKLMLFLLHQVSIIYIPSSKFRFIPVASRAKARNEAVMTMNGERGWMGRWTDGWMDGWMDEQTGG